MSRHHTRTTSLKESLPTVLLAFTFANSAFAAEERPCYSGMCDLFRLSVSATGGTTSANTVVLPGGRAPNVGAPTELGATPIACSKTVRVPEPVYNAIIRTMQRVANRDYLARVQEFTPHEQTMLLFFHTVIQQARGLGSCGGS